MKRGGITHHKTLALADKLGVPLYAAVGLLECLFHLTAQQAPRGDIGRIPDRWIAHHLHWDGDVQTLTSCLLDTGWLDRVDDENVRFVVHDWHFHADQSVQRRLSRSGEGFLVNKRKAKRKPSSRRLASKLDDDESKTSLPEPVPEPDNKNIMSPMNGDSSCAELSEFLRTAILRNTPTARLPASLARWSTTFRLMRDRDHRDFTEVRRVIEWATADSFWRPNILSAETLREKYDQLKGKMERPRGHQQATGENGFVC